MHSTVKLKISASLCLPFPSNPTSLYILSLPISLCTWPYLAILPGSAGGLATEMGSSTEPTPFIIHPTPMAVFLKQISPNFKKQKVEILWHFVFAAPYLTLRVRHQFPGMILKVLCKLLTYTKHCPLPPWTHTLPTGYGFIFRGGQSILARFFQNVIFL